jgi:hypothetical protein
LDSILFGKVSSTTGRETTSVFEWKEERWMDDWRDRWMEGWMDGE